MSNVGYYSPYYQQQSQTYTVPATGCIHKALAGCTSPGQSPKCCYCTHPVQASAVETGRLSTIRPDYCAPCHGFWARRIEAGKGKASSAGDNASSSSSGESPDEARSPALTVTNYYARLNAPFNSVPYIPQAVFSGNPSQAAAASSSTPAAARFKHLMMPPMATLQPQNGSQNAKKRPRQEQHKHSNSENSASSHKRNGGEGSSAGNAIRVDGGGEQSARQGYACPAVRAMDLRRTVASMDNESDRRWTLANPYGVPGGVQASQNNSTDSGRLRPAGTSANSSGGFQTYKPPSPTFPPGQNPSLTIKTTPSSSRNNGNYQNYKPPKGPNYQPYRPGAMSTPTSPNGGTPPASQSITTSQPGEIRPENENSQGSAHSNSILNISSTPLATITASGNNIVSGPLARNQSGHLQCGGVVEIDARPPQNRAASSLRLGDNTISTRSDSTPRVDVPIPVGRLRTRSWDGSPVQENIRENPDGTSSTTIGSVFLPSNWSAEASAAGPTTPNEQNSISTHPPLSSSPIQLLDETPVNAVSSNDGPVTENSSTYEAPEARAHPGQSWLDWTLSFAPSPSQESAGAGPSTAPIISWGSGDTRRNTVAGPPQGQSATPDSPATNKRKSIVSSRTARPPTVGQFSGVYEQSIPSYMGRVPPPRPMETAIPPNPASPTSSVNNGTGGWGSNTSSFQRRPGSDNWHGTTSGSSADFAEYIRDQVERAELAERERQAQAVRETDAFWASAFYRPVDGQTFSSNEQTGRQEPRARRNRSPRNQSPQERSPQNRSPRQRGRRASHSPTAPPTPSQDPLRDLLRILMPPSQEQSQEQSQSQPQPQPQPQSQPQSQPRPQLQPQPQSQPQPQLQPQPQSQSRPQSQPRTSTSSANLAPVLPPIPSVRSSPSEEWEIYDPAALTAVASEIPPNQRDVGKLAENASVLLECFYKTKPRNNADIGDDYKEMIENAYKSIIEIRKEIKIIPADDNAVPAPKKEDSQNSDDCIVCFNNNADTVLLPCKHMVLCGGCCDKMNFREKSNMISNTAQCPVCRAAVDDRMRIYRG